MRAAENIKYLRRIADKFREGCSPDAMTQQEALQLAVLYQIQRELFGIRCLLEDKEQP